MGLLWDTKHTHIHLLTYFPRTRTGRRIKAVFIVNGQPIEYVDGHVISSDLDDACDTDSVD